MWEIGLIKYYLKNVKRCYGFQIFNLCFQFLENGMSVKIILVQLYLEYGVEGWKVLIILYFDKSVCLKQVKG